MARWERRLSGYAILLVIVNDGEPRLVHYFSVDDSCCRAGRTPKRLNDSCDDERQIARGIQPVLFHHARLCAYLEILP